MDLNEIIAMGCKAGLCDKEGADDNSIYIEEHLMSFAKLVAVKERERCAFLCDELWRKGGWDHNAGYAADRIRALK